MLHRSSTVLIISRDACPVPHPLGCRDRGGSLQHRRWAFRLLCASSGRRDPWNLLRFSST